ncbi:uncharacterized protein DSM5745_05839 [Aspergillus mulundensis]|uniref:Uncharacterized protein n=1 Tax=Aspergillus mulundensis TaxID=1810919 RepID=A0A3D8RY46_9EURO|nr:hypothetical protein DSM5745_05839 [Aspergillus mulundensis]RDW78987.1 hypothetical protein DSM5745_05839 [Aspergillus mulundensis]
MAPQHIRIVSGQTGHLLALDGPGTSLISKALDKTNPSSSQVFMFEIQPSGYATIQLQQPGQTKPKYLAYDAASNTIGIKSSACLWLASKDPTTSSLCFKTTDGRKCLSIQGDTPKCVPFTGASSQRWFGFSTIENQEMVDKVNEIEAANRPKPLKANDRDNGNGGAGAVSNPKPKPHKANSSNNHNAGSGAGSGAGSNPQPHKGSDSDNHHAGAGAGSHPQPHKGNNSDNHHAGAGAGPKNGQGSRSRHGKDDDGSQHHRHHHRQKSSEDDDDDDDDDNSRKHRHHHHHGSGDSDKEDDSHSHHHHHHHHHHDHHHGSGTAPQNILSSYTPAATGNICGNPQCGRSFICAADYNARVQPMGFRGV